MFEDLKKALYKEIKEIERTPNKIALLEKVLTNEDYILTLRDDYDYVRCWLQYSGLVQDVDSVFEFMDEAEIGTREHSTYLQKAAFYENYKRDFFLSLSCLDKALDLAPDNQLLTRTLK